MLSTDIWLAIACLSIVCIQGTQLQQIKPTWLLGIVLLCVPVLTWSISDMVSRQSLLTLQELADQQRQTIQIVVLLEAALLCFTTYKVPAFSFLLALAYGQLFSLQSGDLNVPFAVHGLIYGIFVSLFLLANKFLIQREPFWASTLFITVLIATYLTEATLPNTSAQHVNLNEMFISLATLAGTIVLGFIIQRIRLGNLK